MRRIVVTGFAANYPFGGVFWDYFQYVIGFRRLGCEVLYVEDSGRWAYDPQQETPVEDGSRNASYLAAQMERLGSEYAQRWFYRDAAGQSWGAEWDHVVQFCKSADLFLNISGSAVTRDEYFAASHVALIDSDPMYTQVRLLSDLESDDEVARERLARFREYDSLFTFAENIGRDGCRVPKCGFEWTTTRQPVVLDCFTDSMVPVGRRRPMLTTVASWEPAEKGPVVEGVAYKGKSSEFENFIGLAAVSPMPLEVALSGPAPLDRLRAAGWTIVEGYSVSRDPWIYRDYLANSFAEWSIAKNAYVAGRSGWFSCRSACYLALGVPVIAQETGFSRIIPTGEGLLSFTTLEEARAAIARVKENPDRHAKAARELAREYFDSGKILTRLLEQALA
jgi:hypothetical protein